MRNKADLIAAFLFLGLGIAVMIGAVGLRIGTPVKPQAGFFPFLGGISLASLATILLVQAWFGRSIGTESFGKLRGVIAVIAGFIFYAVSLEILGYLPSALVLSGIVLHFLGQKTIKGLIIISATTVIISYLVFQLLLGVSLPSGMLTQLW